MARSQMSQLAKDVSDAIDTPESCAMFLDCLAELLRESAGELESAWQDKNAGKVWERVAKALDRASDIARKE